MSIQHSELREIDPLSLNLSGTELKRLTPVVKGFAETVGVFRKQKKGKKRRTFKQHVIDICAKRPDIGEEIRPNGGKVTTLQCELLLHVMVASRFEGFSLTYDDIALLRRKGSYKTASARGRLNSQRGRQTQGRPSKDEKTAFYASWEWNRLRYQTLLRFGRRCMCCGVTSAEGASLQVDHIKPIHTHWPLRLDPENLQVLCASCNKGKGASFTDDFRPAAAAPATQTSTGR